MSVLDRLRKFADKEYRDIYMQTVVRGGIAYQIQALRRKFRLTQNEFATATGKTQSVISRLENTDYGKMSVQTLLDIASALDVALLVRFVSYPDFLGATSNMSEAALQPATIFESLESGTDVPAEGGVWRNFGPWRQQPASLDDLIRPRASLPAFAVLAPPPQVAKQRLVH